MKNNKYWLLTPYSYIQLGLLLLLLMLIYFMEPGWGLKIIAVTICAIAVGLSVFFSGAIRQTVYKYVLQVAQCGDSHRGGRDILVQRAIP